MNLLYIFLSIIFSVMSPSNNNNEGLIGNENGGTTTTPGSDDGKKGKFGNGDFIIAMDGNP